MNVSHKRDFFHNYRLKYFLLREPRFLALGTKNLAPSYATAVRYLHQINLRMIEKAEVTHISNVLGFSEINTVSTHMKGSHVQHLLAILSLHRFLQNFLCLSKT